MIINALKIQGYIFQLISLLLFYVCRSNRFMWSGCLTSCINYANHIANDENYEFYVQCKEWALEGECEANPNFIQLHCPVDCGLTVAWDPFTRRDLGFDEIPFIESFSQGSCDDHVSDTISAAEVIKVRFILCFDGSIFTDQLLQERLNRYLDGGYNSVTGFTSSSP